MVMKNLTTTLLILVLVVSTLVLAEAQNDNLVTYNVTLVNKRTQKPISGARVNYKKLPYESEVGVLTTNSEGKVTMYFRAEEQYSMLIEPQGYLKVSEIVNPKEGASGDMINNVTFALREGGVGAVLTLENVNFSQGQAVLTETSFTSLDDLADMLSESSQMTIQLEGHTDFRGSPTANLSLSQQRVDAVKKYLVGKGIGSTRITTKAFGGSQPVTRDNNAEARAKNRRVEVRITSDGN